MTLYIENLPSAISKRELENTLLPHGWFDAIRLLRDPATGESIALVETCLPEEAARLSRLDGGEILGRRIRVRTAVEDPKSRPVNASRGPEAIGRQRS